MKRLSIFLRCICFICIVAVIFALLTPIFERKTYSGPWNYTVKVNGYLNSKPNTIDLVAFGSTIATVLLTP